MSEPTHAAPPEPQLQPRRRRIFHPAMLVLTLEAIAGFFHCDYTSPSVCLKESWGLGDTFVDTDDFVGKPFLEVMMTERASTVRALAECELISLPEGLADE